jgi:thiamine biosynthesis protein ThiS
MPAPLALHLNGQHRTFPELTSTTSLSELIAHLALKPDRIAVELNGEIASRGTWDEISVSEDDRLEIVHFVGGGLPDLTFPCAT